MVFRATAEHLQVGFLAGDLDREQVTSILTTVACALTDEGWYAESIDHEIEHFKDWPIITKALRTALGV
jgi:hypothetical protein